MRPQPQVRIDSKSELSPMAIIDAFLAQGAIRFLDRQKREQRAAQKSIGPAEPAQNKCAAEPQTFSAVTCACV